MSSNAKPVSTSSLFVAVKDKIYKLEPADYADPDKEVSREEYGVVFQMRDYGSVLANMSSFGPGIGAACYLLNLDSLKPVVNPAAPVLAKSSAG